MRYDFKMSLACTVADDANGPVPDGLEPRIHRMVRTLAAVDFKGDASLFEDMVRALEGVADVVRRAKACGMTADVDEDDEW